MRERYQRWTRVLHALAIVALFAGCPDKNPKDPACNSDDDCQDGLHCVNGKCVQCGDDSHCDPGESCVNGSCLKDAASCSVDLDCPPGQICKDGQCGPCQNDRQCGPGGRCSEGSCERPKACDVDADCADDEDCIEGRCLRPWKGAAPDGIDCDLGTIYFEFDQAAIRPDERSVLTAVAECINTAPKNRGVYISGHTDEEGTEEYNIALSERRARAVADYLARLGIDPARFYVIAKGEGEPSGDGSERDRRVEFEWR